MKTNNLLQEILDKILDFRQKTEIKAGYTVFEDFKNLNPEKEDEIEITKNLNELFATIRDFENEPKSDNYSDVLNKKIDFTNSSFLKKQDSRFFILKVAAVILPLIVVGVLSLKVISNKKLPAQQVISTLKGSKTKIVLEEGTIVWLNSESKLTYPSTFRGEKKRVVKLTGEAFFEVKRDEKKPFEVYVKGYKVNVLGTSFNVKAYPDNDKVETTLEKGKVNIEKVGATSHEKSKPIVTLKPKQTVILYNTDVVVNKTLGNTDTTTSIIDLEEKKRKELILVENIDLEPYLSWKENKLIFREQPLKDIVEVLERWYNIDITIADNSLNEITCTGNFTDETAEQTIQAICLASRIKYEFDKNTVILRAN